MTDLEFIRVSGTDLVGRDGDVVRLAGVGLGGWMNMENFITGYPGNEENIRRVLLDRMGREAYDAFFETFYVDFFAAAEGRSLDGIHYAMEFLPQQNRRVSGETPPAITEPNAISANRPRCA